MVSKLSLKSTILCIVFKTISQVIHLTLIFVRYNLNTKVKCNKIIYRFYMYEYIPVYLYIGEYIYNIKTQVTLPKD